MDIESVLRQHGIEIVPDFSSKDFKRNKSQWLKCDSWLHDGREYKVAFFGDWATNIKGEWKSWGNEDLNGSTDNFDKIRLAMKKKAKEEREAMWSENAKEAQKEIAAITNHGASPYLLRKGFDSNNDYGSIVDTSGTTFVPLCDEAGVLWNYQRIFAKRIGDGPDKLFRKGCRKIGLFHALSGDRHSKTIYICEGFATAASICLAVGSDEVAVICAFDSGNLEPVAKVIRDMAPQSHIVICADDDAFNKDGTPRESKDNAGYVKSMEAAKACVGGLVLPKFKSRQPGESDFNDLMLSEGIDEVKHQLERKDVTDHYTTVRTESVDAPSQDVSSGQITTLIPENCPNSAEDVANSASTQRGELILPDIIGKRPVGSLRNLKALLQHLDSVVRYNVITKREEILIPGHEFSIDNYDNAMIATIYDYCTRLGMPTGLVIQYLSAIADKNQFNPVKTWIESKEWDGEDRLMEFCNTVEEVEGATPGLKNKLIFKWMISAVAAAYRHDGVSAHGVLVFQGLQGLGKTQWFRRLVPEYLKLTADGKTLQPNDKDSVLSVIKYWLVELGELDATFRKADLAQLKAFLPKNIDEVRAPYAAKSSTFPRRTVFFASVNHEEFLADTTGNRRFWVVKCKSINWNHAIDMQQVWAQIAVSFKMGASWHLDVYDLNELNHSNKASEVISPVEEKIAGKYQWGVEFESRWVKTVDVLNEIGIINPTQRDKVVAGIALKKLCEKPAKSIRGYTHFFLPKIK